MPATVSLKQCIGAGPTVTSITNLRLNTDDTVNPGSTNPLVQPAAGMLRSYWKTVYLNADTSPTGEINNVQIYCDGAIGWTGCDVFVGSSGVYTQATGTLGVTGDDSSVATANMENFIETSPKQLTGSIVNPNTGRITDYIVFQVDLTHSAKGQALNPETITIAYDEY